MGGFLSVGSHSPRNQLGRKSASRSLFIDRPLSYAATRLENVFDILVLLGPLATALLVRGLARPVAEARELRIVVGVGLLTLFAMFVLGAFRTGETSRACAFIYPYLLLPVGAQIEVFQVGMRSLFALSAVTFGQSVLMQLFGHFLW